MDSNNLKISGYVTISDPISGQILFSGKNACHYENLSVAIAQSLISGTLNASNTSQTGFIYSMAFGNGGTTVSSSGIITYNPPNVIGSTAALYNQTYSKVINNNFSADADSANNNLSYTHIPGKAYSDIIIKCLLDYGEPAGQTAFDNSNTLNTEYAFDELGLISSSGQLLTHVIYSPIIKASNRTISITYSLRISTLSAITAS